MPKFREETEAVERDNYEATSREGSKRNCKGKRKGKKMTTKPSTNDVTWHAGDDALLRDAASIAFAYPSGYDLMIGNQTVDLPGIAVIDVFPAVGKAMSFTDPINIAAQKVYAFVRHANSGHSNYDSPDLMTYLLAATSLYSEVMWAQRMYAYAFTYSQRNTYINRGVLEAMGLDVDDFISNLANFRADLNVAISKISSIMVPNTMPVFKWMAFLYTNVYIDGPTIKDQLYFYRPGAFFDFDYDVDEKKPGLILKTINYDDEHPLKAADVIKIINDSINAILDQEDFGIMGGDILKAYGSDNLIGVTYMPEMVEASPVFDETVLHQFKNATIFNLPAHFNGSVHQDINSNALIGDYSKSIATSAEDYEVLDYLSRDRILTIDLDAPTPGDVMEVSRLMLSCYKRQNQDQTYNFELVSGTAIAGPVSVFWWSRNAQGKRVLLHSTSPDGVVTQVAKWVAIWSRFKYLPAVWLRTTSTETPELVFDIDNFVPMDLNDIEKIHRAATLHEYHVDSVAMVTKAQ